MGMSIDLHSYDAEKLIGSIANYFGTSDVEKIREIMACCGEFISDRYLLLNNELWEDYNAYYQISEVLESAFGSEEKQDVFSKCICYSKGSDHKEICVGKEIDEIYESLGIVRKEYE